MVMDPTLRRSLPTRMAACGFILVIFFGNLWLTYALLGQGVAEWIHWLFSFGIVLSLAGGLGMLWVVALRKVRGIEAEPETTGAEEIDDADTKVSDDAPTQQ